MGDESARKWFRELEWDEKLMLEVEDYLQASNAPRKLIGFMHGMIEKRLGKCTMEFFILKDESWRKEQK